MSEHTPGPWAVIPPGRALHRWVIGNVEGISVASCEPTGPWMSPEEADANARLIAAAPTLFDALYKIRAVATNVDGDAYFNVEPSKAVLRQLAEAIAEADMAIKQAEGR